MGKFQYFAASPQTRFSDFLTDPMVMDLHSGTIAEYTDAQNNVMTLHGKGLTYNADGDLLKGVVTSIEIGNTDGATYATITGIRVKAADMNVTNGELMFSAAFPDTDDLVIGSNDSEAISGYRGDDTIRARGGNDIIADSFGSNRVIGGAGNDTFMIGTATKTVIVDFDAHGGDGKQDMIGMYGSQEDYTFTEKGDNVVIENNFGKTILLGISMADLDFTDFL